MSTRPQATTRLPLDGLSLNLMFEDFSEKVQGKFKLR
jgi:hypothetical protein